MKISGYASWVGMDRAIELKHVIKRRREQIINILKHNDSYLNSI